MKKVLHISTALSWRGGEQQICYLVQGLKDQGFENHLWYPKGAPIVERYVGQFTRSYHKRSAIDPITSYKIAKYCRQNEIDILHAHDAHGHNLVWLASSMFGLRKPIIINRRVDFPIKKSSYRKYNAKGISAYICVSEAVYNVLYPSIKKTEKLNVVHSAIDVQKVKNYPSSDYFRKTYHLSRDCKIIANIAAVADHKDYPTFLQSASRIKKRYRGKVKFLAIGGDGGLLHEMKQLTRELDLDEDVIFTGYLDNVQPYINEIDVFLFTSKMEALGTSILDVMSSKVPIVATRAGGIPEMITHDESALLAEIGDSEALANYVTSLLQNQKQASRLSMQAYHDVEAFDYRAMTKKVIEIYNRV